MALPRDLQVMRPSLLSPTPSTTSLQAAVDMAVDGGSIIQFFLRGRRFQVPLVPSEVELNLFR